MINQPEYIELKKKRELGDILTDTFAFLRSQFKPFLTTFLKIVGPYLITALVCMGFYFSTFESVINATAYGSQDLSFDSYNPILLFVFLIVFVFSALAAYVMSQATTLFYLKSYAENNGVANFEEIRRNVYKKFWSFIGLGILVGLSVGIGMMVCCIPGIFLYVPLSISFAIMVFTGRGVTDSFGYSFDLVKDNWWMTFATIFVITIIVTIASYAFQIPVAIYQMANIGFDAYELDAEANVASFIDPIYITLNLIATLAQYLLNVISVTAIALIYFNLNEVKNNEGTLERIQNLGGNLED
ncbi:hypothetical protein H0I23_03235 [Cellulophaga sp. HaHaR_3_176]|uniref:hypothetical protein n=1 Tax=Cellulophaga sp. HaHaR_3_176 TaxID=1942464 RepID=UPI001C1F2E9F|nr:hypothetical protein [Cellulophaga sp. HaHaR_3_176]QWX84675.1 hypothetical protein H0I23_03235 [Cellulophaga sp. HaHaR_3_176]